MSRECGNTAALRKHEAEQDRLEKQAPTKYELEDFIKDWRLAKAVLMGPEFLMEPLNEADDVQRIPLFTAFMSGSSIDLGDALQELVDAYWRPTAEAAAMEHNFAEDREL